jgi:putative hydrolase of the HAD superfamily
VIKYFIFDLDDTLIYEIDFLKSAFYEISSYLDDLNKGTLFLEMLHAFNKNENVFLLLNSKYNEFTKDEFLQIYRGHFPNLSLNEGAKEFIDSCKLIGHKIGLITDGRSKTQRNKLRSVNIDNLFDKIIISEEFGYEKPNLRNFQVFEDDSITEYVYIGDNTNKDFISPNRLGWTTICLMDKGTNIHKQRFDLNKEYLPKYKINTLRELIHFI